MANFQYGGESEMFKISRLWRHVFLAQKPRKRCPALHIVSGSSSECLEDRRLLSAVMETDVAAPVSGEIEIAAEQSESRHERGIARTTSRKKVVPDIAGTWTYTVSTGGTPIEGQLTLTQKGKRITGTLTREFQPPGNLKGRLKSERVREPRGQVEATGQVPRVDLPNFARWLLLGKIVDVSVDSSNIQFEFDLLFTNPDPGSVYDRMEGRLRGPDGEVEASATRNIA